jgi:hypothetical protein
VTQEGFRNSPELLCNLAFSVCNFRLPQFDGIPLGVMQAGEPAVRIRLRVNLDRDPAACNWAAILSRSRTREFTIQNLWASPK